MSNVDIAIIASLGALYLVLVFTLALTTWRKGYTLIFIVGFLIPPLWLLGALLKPKPGSSYKHWKHAHRHDHG